MRTAEAITLTYLTYLLVVAAVRALRLTARRRLLIGTAATGTIIAVMAIPPRERHHDSHP